jgi:hypothetical protein
VRRVDLVAIGSKNGHVAGIAIWSLLTHHDLSAGSFVVVHNGRVTDANYLLPAYYRRAKATPDHPIGGLCHWQSFNAGRKVGRPGLGGSQSPPSSGGRSRLQRSAEPHADHVAD